MELNSVVDEGSTSPVLESGGPKRRGSGTRPEQKGRTVRVGPGSGGESGRVYAGRVTVDVETTLVLFLASSAVYFCARSDTGSRRDSGGSRRVECPGDVGDPERRGGASEPGT